MTERDTTDGSRRSAVTRVADGDPITGRCEHCSWHVVADSHSAVGEAYQDHLRDEHPDAWLRT